MRFYGLYSFVFPFLRDNNDVRTRRLSLYLRHGLESEDMMKRGTCFLVSL